MKPQPQIAMHLVCSLLLVASVSAENLTAYISNGLISGPQPHNVHIMGFRVAAGPNDPSAIFGGGSIVSARHVLTAAHLVHGFGNFQVGYASNQLMQLVTAQANIAIVYPGYVPATRQNDIAILALNPGSSWTRPAAVRPIRWTTNTVEPVVGRVATVVGFGFTTPTENFPTSQLRQTQLTVSAVGGCQGSVSMTGSHFCVMPQSGRNVCAGDGGAGLFIPDASGPVLVGIASTIPAGCAGNRGAGFTRVALYSAWIQRTIS